MATTNAPGRIICQSCSANNFETQAACWKCGKVLGGAGNSAPVGAASQHLTPNTQHRGEATAPTVDPMVAQWVGIIGGLLIPIVMLPVGLAFLMWDDRRKVEVGRTATIASLIGTVLHGIVTYFAVAGAVGTAMKMLPGAASRAQAAKSEPAPDYNSDVKPLNLPGIPSMAPAK